MTTILLVDDDREVLEINARFLKNHGYQVGIAVNGKEGLKLVSEMKPDCIVLDVMMPEMNGFVMCQKIREISNAPIIFLSGRQTEEDRIKGMKLGADDYIVKPYSLRELEVRIMANVRRNQLNSTSKDVLDFYPLKIDIVNHKAYYKEEDLTLTNREFELLLLLVQNEGEVMTFEQIGLKMWGAYGESERRAIMVNASRLRKKFGEYIELENKIETIRSQGYKFSGQKRG